MSMVICDRCGKNIMEREPRSPRLKIEKIMERYGPSCYVQAKLDLCEECERAVYEFIFHSGE